MSDMTAADIDKLSARHASVLKTSRRAAWWPIGILAAALVYLTYAWFAFDIPSLIERARLDRGAIMATDSFAYKYHITWTARDREIVVDVEGGRGTEMDDPPAWVDRGDG